MLKVIFLYIEWEAQQPTGSLQICVSNIGLVMLSHTIILLASRNRTSKSLTTDPIIFHFLFARPSWEKEQLIQC